MASEISLPFIIGGALIDSISPFLIGVMVLLLTVLSRSNNRKIMLKHGLLYVLGVYIMYLVGGIMLLQFFLITKGIVALSNFLYILIGFLTIFFSLLQIKDYFWYGRWYSLSISPRFALTTENIIKNITAHTFSSFHLGAIVTLMELISTGAPYLAVVTLLSYTGDHYLNLVYLLLYNLIFVLPLIVILHLAYKGKSLKKIEKWRAKNRALARLIMGIFLIGMGVFIIVLVNLEIALLTGFLSLIIVGFMFALKKLNIIA